jgi:hypothetical protein
MAVIAPLAAVAASPPAANEAPKNAFKIIAASSGVIEASSAGS